MKNKHITLSDRYDIQEGLDEGKSFRKIGIKINKDPSTISKEVRRNSTTVNPTTFNKQFNKCKHKTDCSHTSLCSRCFDKKCSICPSCNSRCPDFEVDWCDKLNNPPYVCNGCPNRKGCRKPKLFYKAKEAHETYTKLRSESRAGVNLTLEELEKLNAIVIPAIKQGHSPAMIVMNNPDINRSEATIYRDIDKGLYNSINNCDLPRKVKMRKRMSKVEKEARNTKNREGRTYEDYLDYKLRHPNAKVVQIDTVEGIKGGKSLLTIHFPPISFMLAFLIEAQRSEIIVSEFNKIKNIWGEKFCVDFEIILTDNGKENQLPNEIEYYDNKRKIHLFYCDPGKSYQKPEIENNHTFIRRILPKGTSFEELTQDDIDLMMNHINSTPRDELNGHTPYELASMLIDKNILEKIAKPIPRNEVILKPFLLKKKK